jgi:hypothetical protein
VVPFVVIKKSFEVNQVYVSGKIISALTLFIFVSNWYHTIFQYSSAYPAHEKFLINQYVVYEIGYTFSPINVLLASPILIETSSPLFVTVKGYPLTSMLSM